MKIQTNYTLGDVLLEDGKADTIVGLHIYVKMDGTITERAYLGSGKWKTLVIERKRGRRSAKKENRKLS